MQSPRVFCCSFTALMLSSVVFPVLAATPPEPRFEAVEIDTQIEIGYGLALADVDGDGKTDVLLADKSRFVWYQNPSWKRHILTDKLTEKDHVCIAAADIDGDGRAEIAVGAEWNPGDTQNSGAVFYLVPPADRTQKWTPVKLPHEPTVHRMRWIRSRQGGYELLMAPLHGRDNRNGQGMAVRLLTYRRAGSPEKAENWKVEPILTMQHITHNFQPVQWDQDPEHEFVLAGKEGVFLFDSVKGWHGHPIAGGGLDGPDAPGAGEVRDGKLPGGRRYLATVEPWHGNSAVTYAENKATGRWERRVVDETIVDGHAVACGDVLGLGHDQLVVGWRAMNRPGVKVGIRLYSPLDNAGAAWRTSVIDDNTMACEDLTLGDLNGDGKLDVVAAGRATKNVRIYWNRGGK